jgi:hypothetical protein
MTYRYRVRNRQGNVHAGDDLREACFVFNQLIFVSGLSRVAWSDGVHAITGEPLLGARNPKTRRLVAVLYGASHSEFAEEMVRAVAEGAARLRD